MDQYDSHIEGGTEDAWVCCHGKQEEGLDVEWGGERWEDGEGGGEKELAENTDTVSIIMQAKRA